MQDVLWSLLSSLLAGAAGWLGHQLLRYRQRARRRAFFGVDSGASCLLVAPRHVASPLATSVHSRDGAALVELATVVNRCGGRVELVEESTNLHRIGRATEFCVGGPVANQRTAAHLRSLLPGVGVAPDDEEGARDTSFTIDGTTYRSSPSEAYVLLARLHLPARPKHPVFLIAGQHSWTNLAAARYLARRYRRLLRRYGPTGRFCLLLRVREQDAYGPDFVDEVPDISAAAFDEKS